MSSTEVSINLDILVREIFTTAEMPASVSESDRTLRVGLTLLKSLNSTSVPKVDKPPIYKKLAATATIDLTAVQGATIPESATRTLDMTGAKVKAFVLKAGAANAGTVNVAPGGSNPYPLFGTGNDIDLKPGAMVPMSFNGVESGLPAVSGSVKTIDVTITGSDTLEILLILGT